MYRITNVTDRAGNVKQESIAQLKEDHPDLVGEIIYKENCEIYKDRLRFEWADDSNRMLLTSTVLDYAEDEDKVVVTTMNSIYTFESVK